MAKRGRKTSFTAEELERACERYFRSITRERTVTERLDSGRRDDKGHIVFVEVAVKNRLGKELKVIEYLVPPCVHDLCEFLGIDESTWANYADAEKHPEFIETVTRVRGRMRAWNEHEMLTREGKDLKGILFNLENNYGYKERTEVQVSGGVEDYLRSLSEGGEGVREF